MQQKTFHGIQFIGNGVAYATLSVENPEKILERIRLARELGGRFLRRWTQVFIYANANEAITHNASSPKNWLAERLLTRGGIGLFGQGHIVGRQDWQRKDRIILVRSNVPSDGAMIAEAYYYLGIMMFHQVNRMKWEEQGEPYVRSGARAFGEGIVHKIQIRAMANSYDKFLKDFQWRT